MSDEAISSAMKVFDRFFLNMVPKNEECVRQGSISFLIAQHAYQQGYSSVDALFNAIVMKRAVNPVNYMPIEILTRENVDFYRRTAI